MSAAVGLRYPFLDSSSPATFLKYFVKAPASLSRWGDERHSVLVGFIHDTNLDHSVISGASASKSLILLSLKLVEAFFVLVELCFLFEVGASLISTKGAEPLILHQFSDTLGVVKCREKGEFSGVCF